MAIRTIGVAGAGQMGAGIAEVAAQAGFEVILSDVAPEFVRRGIDGIRRNLDRATERGRLAADDRDAALARIRGAGGIDELAAVDFAIEAIVEREDAKCALFRSLDELCPPAAILASNTSSISITRMAAATRRPERFIGMHFMNPVPVMKLVEIVRGLATTDETLAATKELAARLGKQTIIVNDAPGFAVNRVLLPMVNEAIFALQEGVASAADIDVGMKLGTNHPMGPLELADLIGLDTCLYILEVLHAGLGEDKYRPCPLLRKYVDAGYLGRKTGRGFYLYDRGGKQR